MKTKKDSQARGVYVYPLQLPFAGAMMLLTATLAFGQANLPANNASGKNADVVSLDRYEVVGSRIKRLDTETVSPSVQLTTDDIKATGFTSIADAIRALPFNSGQALTPADAGTSFTPGVNSFNLRGLGNNNTLVLINGRRAAPYGAPGYDGFQSVFDLNSIPEAAIESVAILKDGGSATYGSDAVAGVVDFKLYRNYEGVSVSYQVGDYFNTSALQQKVSFVTGAAAGRTRIVVAASWEEQAAVYARDLSFSRNADKTDLAHKANPGYSYKGGTPGSEAEMFGEGTFWEFIDPITDGEFDRRSSAGFPGVVKIPGVGTRTFAEPTDNPTADAATSRTTPYNFQEVAGLFGSDRRYSFYTMVNHDFTDYLYGFAEVSFNRVESRNDAAATPAFTTSEQGLVVGSEMTIPSYNPYNPWAVDIKDAKRRLVETGARINDVVSDTPRLLAGLGGKLDDIGFLRDLTWEAGALYTENSVTNTNPGSVADYRLQQALNGLVRAGDGSLVWKPQDTPGYDPDRVYFNWFGYNEKAMTDFLLVNNPSKATLRFVNYDFHIGGEVADLPGGPLSILVGGEHRNEKFSNIKSDLAATSMIIGGGAGTSAQGSRSLDAVYVEANIPLLKWVEVNLQGRYESYSDEGFKKTMRPKAGIKLRPLSWLIIRGSYSQAFKAPDLAYLYTKAQTTFSNSNVRDPVTGESLSQLQIRVAGNPDLKPETTDIFFGGIAVEPATGRLKGFSASVDYFEFRQRDVLGRLSDLYDYADFLGKAYLGEEPFASKVVRDPVSNQLLYITDDYDNMGKQIYKGWDFDVSYQWDTANLGRFRFQAMGTYIASYTSDGDEVVGTTTIPRVQFRVVGTWRRGDWSANVLVRYIGQRRITRLLYSGDFLTSIWLDKGRDPNVEFGDLSVKYRIKKQIIVNPSITYSGFRNMEITVGVNNVFNQNPPLDPWQGSGYTTGVNTGQPAFWYMRVERRF